MRLAQRIKLVDLEISKAQAEIVQLQAKLLGLQAARLILTEPETKPILIRNKTP